MKGIEDNAIPALKPLHNGYWGSLSTADIPALINWTILKTLVYEFVDEDTAVVTQQERQRFLANPSPTDFWHVAIGYGEPNDPDLTLHRAMILPVNNKYANEANAQITAFYFGKLVVLTAWSSVYNLYPDFQQRCNRNSLRNLTNFAEEKIFKPFRPHSPEAPDELVDIFSNWSLNIIARIDKLPPRRRNSNDKMRSG